MQKFLLCGVLAILFLNVNAQLSIDRNAIFYVQDKVTVSVEGDLSSQTEIQGNGYVLLLGKQAAHINLNGHSITNLLVNSKALLALESDMRIVSGLTLQSGFLQLNNHSLILMEHAVVSGDDNSYVQTSGTGSVDKLIAGKLENYIIPVGSAKAYMPLKINVSGTSQHGVIHVAAKVNASEYKPQQASSYLNYTWAIRREGNLENITASAHYGVNDIAGNSGQLSSYYWNGTSWKAQTLTNPAGEISAKITSEVGELYAMNDVAAAVSGRIRLLNNPARSFAVLEISVKEDRAYHIEVVDVAGRKFRQNDIKATKGVNQHIIDLNGLTAGTYFLNVASPSQKESFRILKID